MRRNKRPAIPHFHGEEFLYRRVPLELWSDPGTPLGVNAIELPDMSVGRSKFGHPEWLRIDEVEGQLRHYDDWGVVGFRLQDIPPERWDVGVFKYQFAARHMPEEWNYPHSEVQVSHDGRHLQLVDELPDEIHLLWREILLHTITVFLKPYQRAAIRQNAPVSFVPELPIPSE